jgi:hypothetical protein
VQTGTFIGRPLTIILTFCMLGAQIRFVLMFEWLTLCPKLIVLPQIAQTFAICSTSLRHANQSITVRFQNQ